MPIRWTQQEMMQIASFGGGLDIDAQRITSQEAIQLASFAATKGSRITFRGAGKWTSQEAIQIASTGQGAVIFAD